MTAEPDLLPCPFCGGRAKTKLPYVRCVNCGGQMCFGDTNESDSAITAWNRRATAARDAEIEALRAEVERWKSLHTTAYDAFRTGVATERRLEARAERLAEALRDGLSALNGLFASGDYPLTDEVVEIGLAIIGDMQAALTPNAALDQEEGRG